MDSEEKLKLAIEALQKIASFGHGPDCSGSGAPVHECGCYDKDEKQIAQEVLQEIGEEPEDR